MKVMHAYGTNGIITEVELPLDAAYDWVDVIVGFDDYMTAVRFANRHRQRGRPALQGDRHRRGAGALRLFPAPPEIPAARAVGRRSLMVAPHAMDPLLTLAAREQGRDPLPLRHGDRAEKKGLPPVFELTWNHTTLRGLRVDPTITYLQVLYPFPTHVESVEQMTKLFGDEVPGHLEFHALRRQRLLPPACRSCASPARSGSTRSSASTRTMAARSSTRTATRWRKAA